MANPKYTGISGITGTTVSIRHATDADRVYALEYLTAHGRPEDDLAGAEIVVAEEGDRIIGFAVLERRRDREGAGCITVVEDGRRRGIGAQVLRHLTEHSPVSVVAAPKNIGRYLTRLGFRRKQTKGDGADAPRCGAAAKRSPADAVYVRP